MGGGSAESGSNVIKVVGDVGRDAFSCVAWKQSTSAIINVGWVGQAKVPVRARIDNLCAARTKGYLANA